MGEAYASLLDLLVDVLRLIRMKMMHSFISFLGCFMVEKLFSFQTSKSLKFKTYIKRVVYL